MKNTMKWRISMSKDRIMIGIRCEEELRDKLKELAKESRRSMNEYIVYVLEKVVEKEEKKNEN